MTTCKPSDRRPDLSEFPECTGGACPNYPDCPCQDRCMNCAHCPPPTTDKSPLHLLEPRANEQIALALAHGAEKYDRRDYMRTDDHRLPMSDYVGRLRRHIDAWDSGEDTDPDSGLSHIAHIGANAHVLLSGASFADDRNSTP